MSAAEQRADALMALVDDSLGGPPEVARLNRLRIEVLGALLERVEWAIAEAKERTF